jgi:MFS family permease
VPRRRAARSLDRNLRGENMPEQSAPVRMRTIVRIPDFRALWVAEAQSLVGDQLARVALAVLAYERTGSPAVTGLVYALTFLPAIVGGATLSGLADRLPRRALMIWCDLIRAALLTVMAVPGMPLAALCCLLVAIVLVGRPFAAAQIALLRDVLAGDSYVVGSGLRMITDQFSQLAGFATGGLIVASIGVRPALLVDAATFVLSATILRVAVVSRPAPAAPDAVAAGSRPDQSLRAALALIFRDNRLRTLLGMGCLATFHVVPEGVAPAYAASLGTGAAAVGLLMAALPLGTVIGTLLLVRRPPGQRSRLLAPLAILTALPLIACAAHPGLAASIALWATSGVFSSYQVEAVASFVSSVPGHHRGRSVGIASSTVIATQGMGLIGFGLLADQWGAAHAVAFAGALAVALALPLAVSWLRVVRASQV